MTITSESRCSCGGRIESVDPTDADKAKINGCTRGCCFSVIACDTCKTRFLLQEFAPDPSYD